MIYTTPAFSKATEITGPISLDGPTDQSRHFFNANGTGLYANCRFTHLWKYDSGGVACQQR
jgi:hypothetical protein